MTNTAKYLTGVALILGGVFASAALAQNAPAAGQEPPPVADEGTTSQLKCIADSSGFKRSGDSATYTIELANKCEQRLKCRVYAYITSSKGPVQGHATMILAPKSGGAAAKKSYVMKVKMMGGMAQSSRECRVF
jgi:gas vesicle protein